MNRIASTLALCAGLWVLAACASTPPPNAAIAQAELAISEAQKQGAAQHAPLALRKAQDKLQSARELAEDDDEDELAESRRLAQQAEVDALVAAAESRRAEARAATQELETSIRILEEEIEYDSR